MAVAADQSRKRVLVIGGSGRVGGSTVRALRDADATLQLEVGGRDPRNFEKAKNCPSSPIANRQRWESLRGPLYSDVAFRRLDLADPASLAAAVAGAALVVNTAGPFQRKSDPEVLQAAIDAGAPYV
ncbi:unnamed protein product, partial [Phaeothamnion confervicola]